jgi:hypothetical protein
LTPCVNGVAAIFTTRVSLIKNDSGPISRLLHFKGPDPTDSSDEKISEVIGTIIALGCRPP